MEVSGAISIISGRRSFNSKFGPKSDFQRQSLGSDLTRFSECLLSSISFNLKHYLYRNSFHTNYAESIRNDFSKNSALRKINRRRDHAHQVLASKLFRTMATPVGGSNNKVYVNLSRPFSEDTSPFLDNRGY
ncbi:hypothetical protein APICC_01626 [Apis cerana cerana]|uniref:Uncharacterized protein n=1 Tax=Apis cerana cerana TaxID=94128 RepID=A0A2A3ENT5_APICC|nr:hypothetical protein APICC_01626 [Apis cerana cerana]